MADFRNNPKIAGNSEVAEAGKTLNANVQGPRTFEQEWQSRKFNVYGVAGNTGVGGGGDVFFGENKTISLGGEFTTGGEFKGPIVKGKAAWIPLHGTIDSFFLDKLKGTAGVFAGALVDRYGVAPIFGAQGGFEHKSHINMNVEVGCAPFSTNTFNRAQYVPYNTVCYGEVKVGYSF